MIQNSSKDFVMQKQQKSNRGQKGRWTEQQHQTFLEGLKLYGKNWKKIELLLKTRTGSQIRSHAQKYFIKKGMAISQVKDDQMIQSFEVGEQHQSITGNSKIMEEILFNKQQNSTFLIHIVQYFNNHGDFNFWNHLVDVKSEKINENNTRKKSIQSFTFLQTYNGKINDKNTISLF